MVLRALLSTGHLAACFTNQLVGPRGHLSCLSNLHLGADLGLTATPHRLPDHPSEIWICFISMYDVSKKACHNSHTSLFTTNRMAEDKSKYTNKP